MIEFLILISSIPIGLLIAWLARDELVAGRKWFIMLIILCTIDLVFCIYLNLLYGAYTSGFIIIVTGISYWKSFDKKWTET